MTEQNHVAPQYQPMAGNQREQRLSVESPQSATQQQLGEMRSGERWSLEATERTYAAGGNGPGSAETHIDE